MGEEGEDSNSESLTALWTFVLRGTPMQILVFRQYSLMNIILRYKKCIKNYKPRTT
jgi:hypothetical protein